MAKKPVYITTTLPYVNAEPHVGHAMEFVRADVIARFRKMEGDEVFFNTGTDEHGIKIYKAAQDAGRDVKDFVDEYAARFREILKLLNVSEDIHFVRTTDEKHVRAAESFWKKCEENGFIYKGQYTVKYCTGCELEKTDSELEDGRCPLHSTLEIELIDEENYFFKFSAFAEKLSNLYETEENFVVPEVRLNEIRSFVKQGLQDFSISRLASKMPWGVPVPGAPEHVMYVWFDALVSYISTLGWPDSAETGDFNKFWAEGETIQYAGKDNLRQQSAMWQAMLMAAGLPNTNHVVINGFITGEGGVKMSKTLGNTIDPKEIVETFGADAFRYFVCRELSTFEDSPFTTDAFKNAYNANLANGLGNLVSRVMALASKYCNPISETPELPGEFVSFLNEFKIHAAANMVWRHIGEADKMMQEKEPFKVVKTDPEAGKMVLMELVKRLSVIAEMLVPLMPETAEKIKLLIKENTSPVSPLFPRFES